MIKLKKQREENKTEKDLKLTGRQLFEDKKTLLDFKLDEEDDEDEEFKDEADSDEDAFCYDKELYAEVDDEEVDFD